MDARPAFVAHRFGRCYGPDSSRLALSSAVSGALAGVETDCVLCADGGVALLHDDLLHRATTLTGRAMDHSSRAIASARLRAQDGSFSPEPPLLLEEALDVLIDTDTVVQLEIKATGDAGLAVRTAEAVCRRVDQYRFPRERIELISFWPDAAAVAAAAGWRARIIVACVYTPEALGDWARSALLHGVILEAPYWTAEVVTSLRDAGLSVMSGVVNDVELLRMVLRHAPDMVSTDRPHELFRELHG